MLAGALAVLRNPHTWPPFLAFFCLYSAAGNLMLWIVPCLRDVYALDARPAASCAMATSLALLVAGPFTGWLSDRVLGRRKAVYAVLSSLQVVLWTVFVLTLGALSVAGLYALLFAMGLAGASFVLVWPIGREVNPPDLDGVAVAVVNFGGFLGRRSRRDRWAPCSTRSGPGPWSTASAAIQCRRTAPGSPCARRWWPGPPCSAC